jgi:hypothetical protein
MVKTENLRSAYKHYKKTVESPVEINTYLKIALGWIKYKMKKVFEGCDVELSGGESLGVIAIRGKKVRPTIDEETGEIRGLTIAWGKTRKLWNEDPVAKEKGTKVYCFNEHTGGIRYKLIWHKGDMKILNKSMYSLRFANPNKLMVHKLADEGKEFVITEKTK